ncbi:MAG: acyl carrier protein [Saprospiraceae bacterium]|nr:acyl carrier protein [Saprospiraceae bacterium]
MKRNLIQIQLHKILSEVGINTQSIEESAVISDNLGLDSFDMIFYLHNLENKFNIEFSDNELPKLSKISSTVSLLEKKLIIGTNQLVNS